MTSKIVGDYEYNLNDRLGSGSFATVYKGRHISTQTVVAIKELKTNQIQPSEIEAMRLLKHPNILRLYKVITMLGDPHTYMILEYCNAGDLVTYFQYGVHCESDCHQIAVQIKDGLKYMHLLGMVHRDLKPRNILVTQEESYVTIKIADFGFAKILQVSQLAETICGSPLYMAPEVLSGHKYTHAADLWSYGVILYEMLTGHTPFSQVTNCTELVKAHRSVSSFSLPTEITVTPACRDLISSLLVVDPNNRMSWTAFFEHPWMGLINHSPVTASQPIPKQTSEPVDQMTQSLPLNVVELLKSFEIIDQPQPFKVTLELPQLIVIMKTLTDLGQDQINLSHYAESQIFYKHAINLANSISITDLHHESLMVIQFSQLLATCMEQSEFCSCWIKSGEACKSTEQLIIDTAKSFEQQGMVAVQMDEPIKAVECFTKSIHLLQSLTNPQLWSATIDKLRTMCS